ncbi:transglycosylase family protein [Streptomyces sp. NBC_00083]|uniref:transglycosylase family protein n=1 Tax=Streptomyces sp. NBC_00083 TaxID=2975647 RepID=UPI0022509890|nr:transglycosylase family protein [Streptomyces sp. NBC_00083]MCX5382006.1 transglycosylase family protein [Streptomyces sp. NBC_00083]
MRSGNGRHRRPRQAPALVVAAGVTGSAIALPLLAATGASAADAGTWNQVASCESGGMWSADFGNGLYGGLQLSQATWEAYGGNEYAQRADLASRAQQIAVAEKVLAAKGPDAFAGCGAGAGLAKGGGSADVDPGVPDTSDGTPSSAPSAPADPAAKSPDATATPGGATPGTPAPDATKPGEPAKSPTPSASTPASPGKHRGTPAPEGSTGATPGTGTPSAPAGQSGAGTPGSTGTSSDSRDAGRHASRGDGASRETGNGPAASGSYTVRPGDNLSVIADANKVEGGWPALYHANEQLIGTDPNLILPGQSLDLKDATAAKAAPGTTAATPGSGSAATPNSVPTQG